MEKGTGWWIGETANGDSLILKFPSYKRVDFEEYTKVDNSYELQQEMKKSEWSMYYNNKGAYIKIDGERYPSSFTDSVFTVRDLFSNHREVSFTSVKEIVNSPKNSTIKGSWSYVQTIDSTVLVIENNQVKRYIYNKKTGETLEYDNWGSYFLTERLMNWEGHVWKQYSDRISFYPGDHASISYNLNHKDILRIYDNEAYRWVSYNKEE